jgi:hypothetical protein
LLGVPVHVIKEKEDWKSKASNGRMACAYGDIRHALKDIEEIEKTVQSLNKRLDSIRQWVESVTVPFDVTEPKVTGLASLNSAVESGENYDCSVALNELTSSAESAVMRVAESFPWANDIPKETTAC